MSNLGVSKHFRGNPPDYYDTKADKIERRASEIQSSEYCYAISNALDSEKAVMDMQFKLYWQTMDNGYLSCIDEVIGKIAHRLAKEEWDHEEKLFNGGYLV